MARDVPALVEDDVVSPEQRPGGDRLVEVVASTESFRELARRRPKDGDRILEIGCCFGQCTVLLAARAAEVLALDTSQECVELAAQRLADAELQGRARAERLDVLAHPQLLRILGSCHPPFTVIFADIGGNRQLEHVMKLLRLLAVNTPSVEYVAVKSEQLAECLAKAPSEPQRSAWWQALQHGSCCPAKLPRRPMQKILMRPVRRTQDGDEICRFANYGTCSKGEDCKYDHGHCHCCGDKGHFAQACQFFEELEEVMDLASGAFPEGSYSHCSEVAGRLYEALRAGGRTEFNGIG
eukprot:TRINITY_DN50201_c0_g1_i1.p1 TRINITY_DN50201_c0_g1~~TRINITY_DN50201_c0_g1_i1.p1  ORF type:complete len:296 (-),score=66.68 TRINITY_DN50201_c0_g1_i1:10-897(-)